MHVVLALSFGHASMFCMLLGLILNWPIGTPFCLSMSVMDNYFKKKPKALISQLPSSQMNLMPLMTRRRQERQQSARSMPKPQRNWPRRLSWRRLLRTNRRQQRMLKPLKHWQWSRRRNWEATRPSQGARKQQLDSATLKRARMPRSQQALIKWPMMRWRLISLFEVWKEPAAATAIMVFKASKNLKATKDNATKQQC